MRGTKGVLLILALAILILLVYAYIDCGREEPRWIEEELPVQQGPGGSENGQ